MTDLVTGRTMTRQADVWALTKDIKGVNYGVDSLKTVPGADRQTIPTEVQLWKA